METPQRMPLNDQRVVVRALVSFGALAIGLILASVIFPSFKIWAFVGLFVGASVIELVLFVILAVHSQRMNSTLLDDVEAATAELLGGVVPVATPVPGRVVSARRIAAGRSTAVLGGGGPQPAGHSVVLAVLPPGSPPRWVCVLAPGGSAPARRSHHLIALHPGRPEAGALVAAGPPAGVENDPRWTSAPTYNDVVGGYLLLLPFILGGLAAGILIGGLVLRLA